MKFAGVSSRYVLKVDEKGRITIPQSVREILGIEPGMFVELVVDTSAKVVVLRPTATGVLASYRIRLRERKDVVNAISAVLEEGSDLKYVELGESECVLVVFVIDNVMVEKLAEKLQRKGVDVVEYVTR